MNKKVHSMLGFATKSGDLCTGEEMCKRGIISKKVSLLFIANDMSVRTSEKVKELCNANGIRFIDEYLKDELSDAIGKKDKVLIGITNKKFSREIISIMDNQ